MTYTNHQDPTDASTLLAAAEAIEAGATITDALAMLGPQERAAIGRLKHRPASAMLQERDANPCELIREAAAKLEGR
ncbi:hypothetical protein [Novosphingopyxis sp. YJ-S2-01]|uniref:hypothetical protein n=1 Tax=Novosphingopyxis sp. YJ-S2-01 TaxID=2794021 RepID=UPI0018DE34C4|nr:hypothetical protein [Novosphingopyxis sp. YJ-S2-01]MBH9537548.1 hypothetical protein [Novosphingopyxis sp. YJ-S2-01]